MFEERWDAIITGIVALAAAFGIPDLWKSFFDTKAKRQKEEKEELEKKEAALKHDRKLRLQNQKEEFKTLKKELEEQYEEVQLLTVHISQLHSMVDMLFTVLQVRFKDDEDVQEAINKVREYVHKYDTENIERREHSSK